ncbi:DNA repair protein RecO [Clostridium aminobutyricum]|uniref:DNA repair protein RecO n=1 Tax=Clostridium aminobutyricum TaxID=33953 RepID=A0A939IIM1_CLOAM|nr:DNA repair protein RecO [Clostridium aminobutyricum]MBN7772693.1 DNA repair protein RecO [Clostridium aminobutyricum]
MYTDTEGLVLKHIKLAGGRKILVLFSLKYGKISAGTNINEKGRSKATLALRPFTYSKFEIYKSRDNYNVNSADVIKSFYKIGEDVDKYMHASYILEFTDKITAENERAPQLFDLLIEYLSVLEKRTKKYSTLDLAFQMKALSYIGCMPELKHCVSCGCEAEWVSFCIEEGGVICQNCVKKLKSNMKELLIYDVDFGIIRVINYILCNPLKSFENLALTDDTQKQLKLIIRDYIGYHLDIRELKSESFLMD